MIVHTHFDLYKTLFDGYGYTCTAQDGSIQIKKFPQKLDVKSNLQLSDFSWEREVGVYLLDTPVQLLLSLQRYMHLMLEGWDLTWQERSLPLKHGSK